MPPCSNQNAEGFRVGVSTQSAYHEAMTINLPAEFRDLVAKKVADGTFQSEEEVVRAALGLLAEQERQRDERFEQLREMAAVGLADLDAGRSAKVTADDLKRMARERYLS
jgi:putative addiction module CopG family antidote